MAKKIIFSMLIASMLFSCTNTGEKSGGDSIEKIPGVAGPVINSLKELASTEGFKQYDNNTVIKTVTES